MGEQRELGFWWKFWITGIKLNDRDQHTKIIFHYLKESIRNDLRIDLEFHTRDPSLALNEPT